MFTDRDAEVAVQHIVGVAEHIRRRLASELRWAARSYEAAEPAARPAKIRRELAALARVLPKPNTAGDVRRLCIALRRGRFSADTLTYLGCEFRTDLIEIARHLANPVQRTSALAKLRMDVDDALRMLPTDRGGPHPYNDRARFLFVRLASAYERYTGRHAAHCFDDEGYAGEFSLMAVAVAKLVTPPIGHHNADRYIKDALGHVPKRRVDTPLLAASTES